MPILVNDHGDHKLLGNYEISNRSVPDFLKRNKLIFSMISSIHKPGKVNSQVSLKFLALQSTSCIQISLDPADIV